MARVLVTEPIAADGIEALRREADVDVRLGLTPEQLLDAIPGYQGLIVRSETKVTAAVLDAGRDLLVVGRAGFGVDNIDVQPATRRGIVVVNAPEGNTIAATEHTIGLMLALARHIPAAQTALQRRHVGALEVPRRGAARQDAGHRRPRPRRLGGRAPRARSGDARHRPRALPDAGAGAVYRRDTGDEGRAAGRERLHHSARAAHRR